MKIFIGSIIVMMLTGCAFNEKQRALSAIDTADLVYGKVIKIGEGDTEAIRTICAPLKPESDSAKVCANLQGYKLAKSAVFNSGRLFTFGVMVPKAEALKEGDLIEFSPSRRLAGFQRVMPRVAGECEWIGASTELIIGPFNYSKAFVSEALMVPQAIVMADDNAFEGGVECNGWSYKTLLQQSR